MKRPSFVPKVRLPRWPYGPRGTRAHRNRTLSALAVGFCHHLHDGFFSCGYDQTGLRFVKNL